MRTTNFTGVYPGIVGKGGPNFTRYVETVLQLITSTPHQFSVIVHHILWLQPFRLFDFNQPVIRLKE